MSRIFWKKPLLRRMSSTLWRCRAWLLDGTTLDAYAPTPELAFAICKSAGEKCLKAERQ